jgi:hypothetical protein
MTEILTFLIGLSAGCLIAANRDSSKAYLEGCRRGRIEGERKLVAVIRHVIIEYSKEN